MEHREQIDAQYALRAALWAIILVAWQLTSAFMVPRDVEFINWWARCNIWYSIIMVGLMLWLHYAIKGKKNGIGGAK